MKKKNFEDLIDESITNIRDDRQETKSLLNDLIVYIGTGSDKHREVGFTLAKYLETLQRSNEQLVKIAALIKKKDDNGSELTEDDRNSIFEELNTAIKQDKPETPKQKGKNK